MARGTDNGVRRAGAGRLSVAAAMMTVMAIKMTNYVLTWTDPEGVERGSAVGYDKASAEHRRDKLEAEGCTDIVISEAKPGELPVPK